jgi:hypothetical protein
VNEHVYAYSNRSGSESALVVYNNHYGSTHGTVDFSAAYADKGAGQLRQRRLREGLGLSGDTSVVLAWRDSLTGLEYLRRAGDVVDRGLTLDLHAYQCHVLLDWRELRASAEQPWDRLCDWLNGHGVPNLVEALVELELQPVHDALREELEPGLVRLISDLAEAPRTLAVAKPGAMERERAEAVERAWALSERFVQIARNGYLARLAREGQPAGPEKPADLDKVGATQRNRVRAAMHFPAVETAFAAPWPSAARRVLPSASPKFTATALWGPVLGWCAVQALAEYVAADGTGRTAQFALDLFDRLRLREPLARAFEALGLEGEKAWRAAARIKVLLLASAGEEKQPEPEPEAAESPAIEAAAEKVPKPAEPTAEAVPAAEAASASETAPAVAEEEGFMPRRLWLDPDIRWLTGLHEAEGHHYVIQERFEELLWWLQMPALLDLASQSAPAYEVVEQMGKAVAEALKTVEDAGYCVDELMGVKKEEAAETANAEEVAPPEAAEEEVESRE